MFIPFNNKQLLVRRAGLIVYDVLAVIVSSAVGLLLRFDLSYDELLSTAGGYMWQENLWKFLPANILITLVIFWLFHLYSSLWTYAGVPEMTATVSACLLTSAAQAVGMLLLNLKMPRSYYFLYAVVLTILVLMSRFAYRLFRTFVQKRTEQARNINVMVIGAGEAGNSLIREMNSSRFIQKSVMCVIDDDRSKIGNYIQGVKVVGGREDIIENAARYDIDEIIVAMPAAKRGQLKEILDICKETKCELKTLPGIYQLVNGEGNVSQLRKVEVEDLLGREPIEVDLDSILESLRDKTVLVTGGGGSIGSELCRQIA